MSLDLPSFSVHTLLTFLPSSKSRRRELSLLRPLLSGSLDPRMDENTQERNRFSTHSSLLPRDGKLWRLFAPVWWVLFRRKRCSKSLSMDELVQMLMKYFLSRSPSGGLGYSSSQTSRISVLGTLHLFHVPTLMWLPCISPLSPSPLDPTPRFAVLTSVSSSHLIVAGGQTLSGETVLETNVFDLKRKAWVSKKEGSEGITGAYGWSSTMMEAKSWSVKTDETQEGLPFSCEEEFGGEVFCWTSAGVSSPLHQLNLSENS